LAARCSATADVDNYADASDRSGSSSRIVTSFPTSRPGHQTDIADTIVELYQLGMSMAAVERRLRLPSNSVARVLEARRIPRHANRNRYVPERDRIVSLHAQGASVATICEELGLGKALVHRVLSEEHVAPHDPYKLPWDEIVEQYKAGESTVRIAKELGV
jgi:hypothetical protein